MKYWISHAYYALINVVKILLLIAGVGLVIFLFITSIAPFRNNFFSALYPKSASNAAGGASISLYPSITASVGQTFTTPVMIDTAGEDIVGVDIQLNFDKTALELTDVTFYPENHTLKDYIPDLSSPAGKPLYLGLVNSTGTIHFSALSGPETVFNGQLSQSNPFALLQFKVLKNTPTSVTFVHTPDSTTDTNLTGPEPIDILATVTNMYVNDPNPPIIAGLKQFSQIW